MKRTTERWENKYSSEHSRGEPLLFHGQHLGTGIMHREIVFSWTVRGRREDNRKHLMKKKPGTNKRKRSNSPATPRLCKAQIRKEEKSLTKTQRWSGSS
jgi:hypothetical protein